MKMMFHGQEITGVGGATGNNYSTEETRIGTWIDGKPLYRKVFQTTSPSASNSYVIDISNLGIDTVINIFGIINVINNVNSKKFIYCNQYLQISGSFLNACTLWIDNNRIGMACTFEQHRNQPTNIIIEYTKTTD